MATVKIFLASSAELHPDRVEFEQLMYQRSILWQHRGLFFELVKWENFLDHVTENGLQKAYNEAITNCDIFVMLFWTKVGKYTEEEFDAAYKSFKEKGKPLIYTYVKDVDAPAQKDPSLETFKKKLKTDLAHYVTVYKETKGLLLHFWIQLDKLYTLNLPEDAPLAVQKTSKDELKAMVDQEEFDTLFERLNERFLYKNDKLNTLVYQYVTQPNNFNPAMFRTQLKIFINNSWK